MDHNSESSTSASESPTDTISPKERKTRGPTKLTPSWQLHGRKLLVVLNTKKQPMGPTRKDVATECGKLCRSFCPINCSTWKHVPDSVKAKIMVEIEENFECHNFKNWQPHVLNLVRDRFSDFKSRLYERFILPNLDNFVKLADPPAKYTSITKEQWQGFVMERTSKDWEPKRKKAQESRKKNIYPHRLSRKGYAGLEEELQREKKTNEPIKRHVLWKEARLKDGKCNNEKVREKVDLIDKLSSQVEDGSLIAEGRNDVLAQALGMVELGGRVMGLGHGVTLTSFFTTPEPTYSLPLEVTNSMMKMQKFMVALASEVHRIGGQFPEGDYSFSLDAENIESNSVRCSASGLQPESQRMSPSPHDLPSQKTGKRNRKRKPVVDVPPCAADVQPSKKTTQNDTGNDSILQKDLMPTGPSQEMTGFFECSLALGSRDNIVAHGYLDENLESNILHGTVISEGNARVSVCSLARFECGNELLPIPTQGASTVAEALGGYVAWPRHLIIFNSDMGLSMPYESNKNYKESITSFGKLFDQATKDCEDHALNIKVHAEVFKTYDPKRDFMVEIPVFKDELMHVINFEEIGISMIRVYMCALFSKLKEIGVQQCAHKFAPPAGRRGHTIEVNEELLCGSMNTAESGQICFYPFNVGFHWVLAVVDPWRRHTFYFDPLGNAIDETLQTIIKNACTILDFNKKFQPSKMKATFNIVQCSKQSGKIECGYYVMRYMKDIVESRGANLSNLFASNESYNSDQIDEVRVELLEYMRDHM